MPPLPPVPNVIKTAIRYVTEGNENIVNVMHWSYTGSADATDLLSFANALQAAWGTDVMARLTNTITLEDVTATDLSSSTAPEVVSTNAPVVGSDANPPLAIDSASVVKCKIVRRFRGGHPRIYVPGASEARLFDDRTWNNTWIAVLPADVQAVATSVAVTFGTLTIVKPVSVSYFEGFHVVVNPITGRARNVPLVRVGGPVVDVIQSFSLNPIIGSQRRRTKQSS
jgi:hypothetical protein